METNEWTQIRPENDSAAWGRKSAIRRMRRRLCRPQDQLRLLFRGRFTYPKRGAAGLSGWGVWSVSAGSRLREFVDKTQHAPHAHVDGANWFKRLNLDALARDLQLEEVGKDRGEREEPPSGTVDFDEVEGRILDLVRDKQSDAEQEFREQRDTYIQRLGRNGLLTIVSEIDEAAKLASTKIDHAVSEARGALPVLAAKAKAARSEYELFRADHGLVRSAKYPPLSKLVLQWLLVILLLVVETAANGAFFAKGSDLGLVGGWSDAAIFAAVNIAVALVVGQTAGRYVGHRDQAKRLVAIAGLLAWAIFTLGFAMFVGHYRDALEGQAVDAFSSAVASISVSPLGFSSVHSWVLLFAGCLFAFVALFDARLMNDPYPGFGAVARAADEAEDEYEDERKNYLETIKDAYEDAITAMARMSRDSGKRMADSERILVDLKTLSGSYKQHLTYLEGVGNNLLQLYRDANKRARSTKAPTSFRKKWKEFAPPDGHLEPAEYSRENLERVMANAEKKRDVGNARLEKKRAAAAASLKTLQEI